MRSRYSTLATAIALALGSSAVGAAGIDDMFTLRGYGTIGGVYSTQSEGDYVHDMYAQKEGVGRSESVSPSIDSRTALQLDAQFTQRFSAVIQVVSEPVYNNTWDDEPNDMWFPSLEWANVSYRLTDEATIRAGRIVLPLLMMMEYQKVGYANHWMRTPSELYGKLPYTSLDGGDFSLRHPVGKGQNTLRVFSGSNKVRREDPLPSGDIDMYGGVSTFELGGFQFRAAYAKQKGASTLATDAQAKQLSGLASAYSRLGSIGAGAAEVLNELAHSTTPGVKSITENYAVGVSYDAGNWFAMGEGLKVDSESRVSTRHTSYYVSGGARFGKWTPYASYAVTESEPFGGVIPTAGLPNVDLGGGFNPYAVANGLNNAEQMQIIKSWSQDQSTASVGVRWDATSHLAVKAQYDHIMLPNDSTGMFINRTAEFEPGKAVGLFGLSVDFVF